MTAHAQHRIRPQDEYEHQAALILVERLSREGLSEDEIVRELEQLDYSPPEGDAEEA